MDPLLLLNYFKIFSSGEDLTERATFSKLFPGQLNVNHSQAASNQNQERQENGIRSTLDIAIETKDVCGDKVKEFPNCSDELISPRCRAGHCRTPSPQPHVSDEKQVYSAFEHFKNENLLNIDEEVYTSAYPSTIPTTTMLASDTRLEQPIENKDEHTTTPQSYYSPSKPPIVGLLSASPSLHCSTYSPIERFITPNDLLSEVAMETTTQATTHTPTPTSSLAVNTYSLPSTASDFVCPMPVSPLPTNTPLPCQLKSHPTAEVNKESVSSYAPSYPHFSDSKYTSTSLYTPLSSPQLSLIPSLSANQKDPEHENVITVTTSTDKSLFTSPVTTVPMYRTPTNQKKELQAFKITSEKLPMKTSLASLFSTRKVSIKKRAGNDQLNVATCVKPYKESVDKDTWNALVTLRSDIETINRKGMEPSTPIHNDDKFYSTYNEMYNYNSSILSTSRNVKYDDIIGALKQVPVSGYTSPYIRSLANASANAISFSHGSKPIGNSSLTDIKRRFNKFGLAASPRVKRKGDMSLFDFDESEQDVKRRKEEEEA
eukprot:Ihof_evm2s910 gene=Ihof_evmTU2s910